MCGVCALHLKFYVLSFPDEHTLDLGPDGDKLFPDPPASQLTRWKPISLPEVQVCQFVTAKFISVLQAIIISVHSLLRLLMSPLSTSKRRQTVSSSPLFNSMKVCNLTYHFHTGLSSEEANGSISLSLSLLSMSQWLYYALHN